MKTNYTFIFLTIVSFFILSCAKTGRPDGGPKDETPPLLVTSEPSYKSINFKEKEVKLYFNEFVKLKDLNKQLIVSPPLKTPLLVSPQGTASKFIKIKIVDTLKKNTTYIFNFGNAIEDNNENNKLENFKYVFSTGNYIDSLKTSGIVKDAYKNKQPKKTNIALYRIDSTFTDSIVFKEKPNYVTSALDTTKFDFTNLKEGKYLLIALEESFNDYIYNPKLDKIGFYKDTITLPKDSILTTPISIFKEEQPYQFIRAKEVSKGKIIFAFEGKKENLHVKLLSKVPEEYKSIAQLEKGKDTLNYWHTPLDRDSLNFIVSNNKFLDTITVKFRKKKIDSLKISSTISGVLHFRDTFFIESNTPIIKIDTTKINFSIKDSIAIKYKKITIDKENRIAFLFDKQENENYNLQFLPAAFQDIYKVTNDTLNYKLKTKEVEDYGKITLNIENPNSENVIIDLLSGKDKDKIVDRKYINNSGKLVFNLLEPQTYTFRAIIDANNNKKWDTGNYLLKTFPEKVIYYKEELEVRANYFLENTFIINNLK